ncbi:hypothetical protein YQE_09457, partial [Dendroctonus ponderosae]
MLFYSIDNTKIYCLSKGKVKATKNRQKVERNLKSTHQARAEASAAVRIEDRPGKGMSNG